MEIKAPSLQRIFLHNFGRKNYKDLGRFMLDRFILSTCPSKDEQPNVLLKQLLKMILSGQSASSPIQSSNLQTSGKRPKTSN